MVIDRYIYIRTFKLYIANLSVNPDNNYPIRSPTKDSDTVIRRTGCAQRNASPI